MAMAFQESRTPSTNHSNEYLNRIELVDDVSWFLLTDSIEKAMLIGWTGFSLSLSLIIISIIFFPPWII